MQFKLWESDGPKIIDSTKLTQDDQRVFGNAAVVEDGFLIGYHLTDSPAKVFETMRSPKKLTATYRKGMGKYAELGPGLYVSAVPHLWANRSTGKWDFLKTLTQGQRQKLADAILDSLKPKMIDGREWRYVSRSEEKIAKRDVNNWLSTGFDPVVTSLAGQPYNVPFWKPEFLKPLGIEPSPPPKILKVTFTGKFVNLSNHVGDWPVIAQQIRDGHDGGFNPGGIIGYPELVIWRKECIKNIEED